MIPETDSSEAQSPEQPTVGDRPADKIKPFADHYWSRLGLIANINFWRIPVKFALGCASPLCDWSRAPALLGIPFLISAVPGSRIRRIP
jgi:hypothetical protein